VLGPGRNVWASYRPKVPITALKDSLKQSQSGFQSTLRPDRRFLNRYFANLLQINILRQLNWCSATFSLVSLSGKEKSKKSLSTMYPKGSKGAKAQSRQRKAFP
jgi:hypothetical protein